MFSVFWFVDAGELEGVKLYRLRCPKCGGIDMEVIASDTLADLKDQGEDSFCIDCDPNADEQIPYRLTEKGQLTASVYVYYTSMQKLVAELSEQDKPTQYFEGERNAYRRVLDILSQP